VTAPLADQLADYLTFRRNNESEQRLLSELPLREINDIRRAIQLEPLKTRYTGPVRKKAPRVRAQPGKRSTSKRKALLDLMPGRIDDAQPVRWFTERLNPPLKNVHAILSDMYKAGLIRRREMKKTGRETHRPSLWCYWKGR
jgi:hypothetical protein